MKTELLRLGVQLVTLLITAYLAPMAKAWLTEKVEDARLARIKTWALKAVRAAEQTYKDYERRDPHGTKRLKLAREVMQRANKRCGLGLTDADIEILIEAAVHEVNTVDCGFYGVLPETGETKEEEADEVRSMPGGEA